MVTQKKQTDSVMSIFANIDVALVFACHTIRELHPASLALITATGLLVARIALLNNDAFAVAEAEAGPGDLYRNLFAMIGVCVFRSEPENSVRKRTMDGGPVEFPGGFSVLSCPSHYEWMRKSRKVPSPRINSSGNPPFPAACPDSLHESDPSYILHRNCWK